MSAAARKLRVVDAEPDAIEKAHAAGERAERGRIVAYLLGLDGDDSYEHESPTVIAERLLVGLHRTKGRR